MFGSSKSKQKSKQQSTQESGTRWNPDFLGPASDWASGRGRENFDSAAYLKAHPDVAADPIYGQDPYRHYMEAGRNDPSGNYKFISNADTGTPTYNPDYVGTNFTSVAPGGFDKLESSLYDTQSSKLSQAYNQAVARQREELAQSGGLNSPAQYLEGSARSSMDKDFLTNLQQAARDAFMGRLGAEQTEAGRKTAYDVGEAGRRTAFNQDVQSQLLNTWLKKLALAIESGRYATGQSTGSSSGGSGGFSMNLGSLFG